MARVYIGGGSGSIEIPAGVEAATNRVWSQNMGIVAPPIASPTPGAARGIIAGVLTVGASGKFDVAAAAGYTGLTTGDTVDWTVMAYAFAPGTAISWRNNTPVGDVDSVGGADSVQAAASGNGVGFLNTGRAVEWFDSGAQEYVTGALSGVFSWAGIISSGGAPVAPGTVVVIIVNANLSANALVFAGVTFKTVELP